MKNESYEFIRPLGQGSFGSVWRVRYLEQNAFQDRLFAAKISNDIVDSPSVTNEMQLTSEFFTRQHENIVTMFLAEEFHGRLLLLLELGERNLLERWDGVRADSTFFPSMQLVNDLEGVASALDYIHSEHLVHGGINPTDLVCANGVVKIADPGPVAANNKLPEPTPTINLCKAFCMAPERARGYEDIQSDQFSLASTYVWLKTGSPLFDDSVESHFVHSRNVYRKSEQEVLSIALARDPRSRFESCTRFIQELRRAV